MKRVTKKWMGVVLALAMLLALGLTACGGGGGGTTTYTVRFNLNGGSGNAPAIQTVEAGKNATDPGSAGLTGPEGTEFAFWSVSATGEAYDFGQAVNADLTLYAVWKTSTVTVTFDQDNGTVTTAQIPYGGKAARPAEDPVKGEMTFLYWANEGQEWDFNTLITGDLTLKAVYGYQVVFQVDGETYRTEKVAVGAAVSEPTEPYLEGNTFGGWYTDAALTEEYDFESAVNGNLTLYAKFNPIRYATYWYNLPEGAPMPADDPDTSADESTMYLSYYYRQELTSGAILSQPVAPSVLDNGYTFLGWYQDAECTIPAVFGGEVTGEEDLSFYGKWEEPATSYKYFLFNRVGSTYEISFNKALYGNSTGAEGSTWEVPQSITIPGTYRGLPVAVAAGGFAGLTLLSVNEAGTHYEYATWTATGCGSLKEIILSEGVISIGAQGFYNNLALTKVVLPSTLTSIGEYAFAREVDYATHVPASEHLVVNGGELIIPARVSTLGAYAFRYTQFTSVVFETGSRVSTIPTQCFSVCPNLESIVLPENLVTISDYGLNAAYKLKSVTFPSTLRTLGSSALMNARELTEILGLENTRVTAIPANFVAGAVKLTSITLPEGITSFGGSSFAQTGLTTFTFHNGVTEIPTSMFYDCKALTQVLFDSDIQTLTTVADRAFGGCSALQSLVLPGSVTTIGNYAFENCGSLERFVIPLRCQTLGTAAFRGCTSLEEIVVPENSTTYQSIDGSLYSYDGTILYCPAPGQGGTFTIAEGTEIIWQYAFYNMSSITEVIFPSTLRSIGYGAFGGADAASCPQVAEYVFPASLTEIGQYAFAYTSAAFSFAAGSQMDTLPTLSFANYAGKNLVIPDNITTLETGAFLLGTMETVDLNQVKFILNSVFSQCNNLTELIIPDGLEVIGNWAFTGNVTGVPEEYQEAPDFTALNIPSSVVIIGDYAFADNIALQSLTFAENSRLMYVGTYSFYNTEITALDLSACVNLRSIGAYAFAELGLTTLTFPEEMVFTDDPSTAAESFATSVNNGTGSTVDYQTICLNEMYGLALGDRAFSRCEELRSVVLPEGLISLGTATFGGASVANDAEGNPTVSRVVHIESITLPSTLVSIGEYAFAYNDAMKEIVIPNGSFTDPGTGTTRYLTEIPMYAFTHMYALEKVTIQDADKPASEGGSRISLIESYSFRYDAALTEFTLPYELAEIGLDAFTGAGVEAFTIGDPAENLGANFKVIGGDIYSLDETVLVLTAAKSGTEGVYEIRSTVREISEAAMSGLQVDKIIFPTSIQTVGRFAVRENTYVKALEFASNNPNTISLGQRLAMDATSLSSVDFGENNKFELSTFLFQHTGMTRFVMPDGMTDVPDGMYYACGDLTEIDLTGITSLGSWVFAGYTLDGNVSQPKAETVVIPNTMVSMGQEVFRSSSIRNFVFEENSKLTEIPYIGFLSNSVMTSFTVPASVRLIGNRAFESCTSLTTLTLEGTTPPTLGQDALKNCTALAHIYVPADSVNSYRNASGWSAYRDLIEAAPAAGTESSGTVSQPASASLLPEALAADFGKKKAA